MSLHTDTSEASITTIEAPRQERTLPSHRILHVVEATFAGVGRHVLDLAGAQANAGHEVHVAYSPLRMSNSFRQEMESLENVRWFACEMQRSIGLHDYPSVQQLRKHFDQIHPDVLHGHSAKGGALARLASYGKRCLTLYTPNGIYSMNPNLRPRARFLNDFIERRLASWTDAVIAVSGEEAEHIAENIGITKQKTHVVNNGISPIRKHDKADVRNEHRLPHDKYIVGFVGRLDDQKSPQDLVRVYAAIAEQEPNAHFVVVGTGSLNDEVQTLSRSFPALDGRIHWLGEQPGVRAMAAFDLFLLPSAYEGFPYVLLEATSSGLPIVTTHGACARDIVSHGESGFICDHGDIAALSDAALELIRDPHAQASFSQAALEKGKPFSVTRMASEVEDILLGLSVTPRSAQ